MADLTAANTLPMDTLVDLGGEIRQLRKIRGLTLEQMAETTTRAKRPDWSFPGYWS